MARSLEADHRVDLNLEVPHQVGPGIFFHSYCGSYVVFMLL